MAGDCSIWGCPRVGWVAQAVAILAIPSIVGAAEGGMVLFPPTPVETPTLAASMAQNSSLTDTDAGIVLFPPMTVENPQVIPTFMESAVGAGMLLFPPVAVTATAAPDASAGMALFPPTTMDTALTPTSSSASGYTTSNSGSSGAGETIAETSSIEAPTGQLQTTTTAMPSAGTSSPVITGIGDNDCDGLCWWAWIIIGLLVVFCMAGIAAGLAIVVLGTPFCARTGDGSELDFKQANSSQKIVPCNDGNQQDQDDANGCSGMVAVMVTPKPLPSEEAGVVATAEEKEDEEQRRRVQRAEDEQARLAHLQHEGKQEQQCLKDELAEEEARRRQRQEKDEDEQEQDRRHKAELQRRRALKEEEEARLRQAEAEVARQQAESKAAEQRCRSEQKAAEKEERQRKKRVQEQQQQEEEEARKRREKEEEEIRREALQRRAAKEADERHRDECRSCAGPLVAQLSARVASNRFTEQLSPAGMPWRDYYAAHVHPCIGAAGWKACSSSPFQEEHRSRARGRLRAAVGRGDTLHLAAAISEARAWTLPADSIWYAEVAMRRLAMVAELWSFCGSDVAALAWRPTWRLLRGRKATDLRELLDRSRKDPLSVGSELERLSKSEEALALDSPS